MPVLFTMYRECKQDSIVCKSIEFVVKQFYVIHRKPFVLQFLGSVAHLVHVDNPLSHTYVTQEKVSIHISRIRWFFPLHCPSKLRVHVEKILERGFKLGVFMGKREEFLMRWAFFLKFELYTIKKFLLEFFLHED